MPRDGQRSVFQLYIFQMPSMTMFFLVTSLIHIGKQKDYFAMNSKTVSHYKLSIILGLPVSVAPTHTLLYSGHHVQCNVPQRMQTRLAVYHFIFVHVSFPKLKFHLEGSFFFSDKSSHVKFKSFCDRLIPDFKDVNQCQAIFFFTVSFQRYVGHPSVILLSDLIFLKRLTSRQ